MCLPPSTRPPMYGSLKNLSPKQLVRKVSRASARRVRQRTERIVDALGSTFGTLQGEGEINRIMPDMAREVPIEQHPALAGVTANYLQGRFDVLGSGWLSWRYGALPPGREGHRMNPGPSLQSDPEGAWIEGLVTAKNLPTSRNLWRLIEGPHSPIDWQLDARSGARWSATIHALDTPIGLHRGADVKAPWELAKLQHLPRLALAYGLAKLGRSGFLSATEYARVYRNQVLDFLALNPPRFGANWSTAMLAGIRIANILMAHDLFRAAGAEFDAEFERIIVGTTRKHIDCILSHLDWWDLDARNNHYLANVAGLAFGAAYLPTSEVSESILAFARNEIASEVRYQFNPDGSHFEGSSAYHAFSAEMVAWTLAILDAVDAKASPPRPQALPSEARRRAFDASAPPPLNTDKALRGMLSFLYAAQRPDGALLQVGDNDSGRFIRLDVQAEPTELKVLRRRYLNLRELPESDGVYWHEGALGYASTIAALEAKLGCVASTESSTYPAILHLVGGVDPSPERYPCPPPPAPVSSQASVKSVDQSLQRDAEVLKCSEIFRPSRRLDLTKNLNRLFYADFGLCLLRSDHLWLAIRCGRGHGSDGGHSHADALSFELHMDGRVYRVDPGAYVYTSLPWRRQQFRSASSHGIPRLRGEGVSPGESVFAPSTDASSSLLAFDQNGLVGSRESSIGTIYRSIRVYPDRVEVTDFSRDGQPVHVEPLPWWSPGYGRLVAFNAGESPADDAPSRGRVDRPMVVGSKSEAGYPGSTTDGEAARR